MTTPSPRDLARRAMRPRIEALGQPGRFLVLCPCGWSHRVDGRAQAQALSRAHGQAHRAGAR